MRSLFTAICLAGLSVTPTTASALSCMPYNAIAAYNDAAKSDDDYVVVHGTLQFDESKLPKVDWQHQEDVKPDNHLTGRIEGKSLTRNGFTAQFMRGIDINVQCYGPWCSGLTSGAKYLAYLKKDGDHYLLETNPCGGFAFQDPDRATLFKVTACLNGKRCDPDLPRR
ncbi:hypothetical protein SAMN04488030_2700 [Aliiroseovarius halocynthiae]|uniref:Lipoprotein n=1 Tax=Aliiroseovarius halocynthiae TaxID=985055 RepID=A0A545SPA9_9RHOB|nr:hypothetical protein [Aliiroseovarius halocynthiae]TQV66815.1 hypothetical protein FIL88_12010 [Aliiroseovarius halocynthiae]SMR82350.1 hypothetical protein SAMN04488030_2700 [Aliiroseovarius halocynthiae]